MKLSPSFLLLMLLGGWTSCVSAESVSDAEFFDFISPDPKAPPGVAPEIKTPSEANAMLEKWREYELSETKKQNEAVQAGRNMAVEMLQKKALTATAESRSNILAEAQRIKAVSADAPLLNTDGQKGPKLSGLVGKWKQQILDASHEFTADGTELNTYQGKTVPYPWRWVDSEAGVLVSGTDFGNIFWVQKPGFLSCISSSYTRFTAVKLANLPVSVSDPITVKLADAESTNQQALGAALTTQRTRVINWLLQKAKQMSPSQTAEVVENVLKLEAEGDEKSGFPSKLRGLWRWDKLDITFEPFGIIAVRDGRKVGRWAWLTAAKKHFVVVLNGGKTAQDIFLVDTPIDQNQTSVVAYKITAGKFNVTRKFP